MKDMGVFPFDKEDKESQTNTGEVSHLKACPFHVPDPDDAVLAAGDEQVRLRQVLQGRHLVAERKRDHGAITIE